MFTGAKRGGLIKGNALLLDNERLYVMISLKENYSERRGNLFANFRLFKRMLLYSIMSRIFLSYSIINKFKNIRKFLEATVN